MPQEIKIQIPEEGEIWRELPNGADVRVLDVETSGRTYFEWLHPAYLVENSLPTVTFVDRFCFVPRGECLDESDH